MAKTGAEEWTVSVYLQELKVRGEGGRVCQLPGAPCGVPLGSGAELEPCAQSWALQPTWELELLRGARTGLLGRKIEWPQSPEHSGTAGF